MMFFSNTYLVFHNLRDLHKLYEVTRLTHEAKRASDSYSIKCRCFAR